MFFLNLVHGKNFIAFDCLCRFSPSYSFQHLIVKLFNIFFKSATKNADQKGALQSVYNPKSLKELT